MTTKVISRSRKVMVPYFGLQLIIIVTKNLDVVNKKRQYYLKQTPFIALTHYDQKKSTVTVLISPDATESLIAHEANHVKNDILDYIDFKISLSNDELDSYIIQWVVEQIRLAIGSFKKMSQ
jgi:hypothetical protein